MGLCYKEFESIVNGNNSSSNKEEFENYYRNHTVKETADYFNVSVDILYLYCKRNGYSKGKFQEVLNRISKEDLIKYYIDEDHGWEETAEHFNITQSMFDKIKLHYGIKKDFSKLRYKELEKRYKEYGSKEVYEDRLREKTKQTKIKKYGSLEIAYKRMGELISETWSNKTPEEKQLFVQRMLANGGGWNHKTALKTLKDKYGVNNSYALAKFKSQSKLNQEFELFLLQNDIICDAKEFVLKRPEGSYYRYDFKVGNVLIELNPWITHNSSWNIFEDDSPLDPNYHYNKTKLALENGYQCICVFDWVSKEDVLKLLKKGFQQAQYESPQRYLLNIKNESEYKISEDNIYNNDWVVIYDDGSVIY